jgi:hemerythrin-like domain-containing protein
MARQTTANSILYDEHAAISTVLGYLERAVDALERGQQVDPAIFGDLVEFFILFVGRCHHGKEESLLFPTLRQLPALARLDAELEQEQEEGTDLVAAFAGAVTGYAEYGLPTAGPLITAARAYAAFLDAHIARENEALLPQVERQVSPVEQEALVAAFVRYEDEVMGAGTHERLHHMIDTLGPRLAPYDICDLTAGSATALDLREG